MKKFFCVILSTIILTSCNKNETTYIDDPGNYEETNTYVVSEKVENINGDKILPFNTMMNLTTYSENVYSKLTPLFDKEIKRLHILFDRYNLYKDENGKIINNLKVINDSYGKNEEIIIDDDLFELLEISINLAKLTKGYFNPTMGYLIDGWTEYYSPYGLTEDSFTVSDDILLSNRKDAIVSYENLDDVIKLNKTKKSVIFNKNSESNLPCIISLGAIAKGYAIEYLRREFSKHNTPLIISGSASSSYMQGKNPNPSRDNWNIQINSSYKNEIYMSLPLLLSELTPNKVMSTSGDYEQLFYYKNNDELIRRHHILNPYSGHSEDYFRSINLYSDTRSDILDGLSTALFNIDDFNIINNIIDDVESYYDINIDCLFQKEISDKKIDLFYNEGFENTITKYYDYVEINEKTRI